MKTKIKSFLIFFMLIILSMLLLIGLNYFKVISFPYPLEQIETLGKNNRILVIAPHCDDETLGPGGIIYKALKEGNQVQVVLMTNGDGFTTAADLNFPIDKSEKGRFYHLALLRQSESIKALKILGLPEENIIFLGYPDGGLSKLWFNNWDKDKPYFNPHIKSDYSPYARNYTLKALYTGCDVVEDLTKVIKDYHPTIIYYPHPNDQHPDHWATNAFTKYILTREDINTGENLYLVHRGLWPTSLVIPKEEGLLPPESLANIGTDWERFPLDSNEQEHKKRALLAYNSQVKVMKYFLMAFVRSNELFGSYPNLSLPKEHEKLLIEDPSGDSWTTRTQKDGDITGIYGYILGDKLKLKLTLEGPPRHALDYQIHLVLLGPNKTTSRADIIINKKLTVIDHYSQESLGKIPNLKTEITETGIYLTLPLSSLPSFQYLFLNAESRKTTKLLDKTAWRMLKRGS